VPKVVRCPICGRPMRRLTMRERITGRHLPAGWICPPGKECPGLVISAGVYWKPVKEDPHPYMDLPPEVREN